MDPLYKRYLEHSPTPREFELWGWLKSWILTSIIFKSWFCFLEEEKSPDFFAAFKNVGKSLTLEKTKFHILVTCRNPACSPLLLLPPSPSILFTTQILIFIFYLLSWKLFLSPTSLCLFYSSHTDKLFLYCFVKSFTQSWQVTIPFCFKQEIKS